MKKTGWIVGIVILSLLSVVLIVMTMIYAADSDDTVANAGGDTVLKGSDATVLARKASELYCFAVYYTDKALSTDPQSVSYEEWGGYLNNAKAYWDALEEVTDLLDVSVTDESFEDMFSKQAADEFALINTAHALEAKEILQVFDAAPAGKRLRTLAKHLNSDMKYARAALKMANGQITAEAWNNFGDTAQKLESAARGLRSAGKVAATAAGLMATGGVSGVLESGVLTVSGADTLMQIADDGAFIALGEKYDSNEFVAALNKTQDTWSHVSGPVDVMFGDMNDPMDATMFMLTTADNIRSLLQEGKFLGYDLKAALKGNGAVKTEIDAAEMVQYLQASANGQELPEEVMPVVTALVNQLGMEYEAIAAVMTGTDASPVADTITDTDTDSLTGTLTSQQEDLPQLSGTFIYEYTINTTPTSYFKDIYTFEHGGYTYQAYSMDDGDEDWFQSHDEYGAYQIIDVGEDMPLEYRYEIALSPSGDDPYDDYSASLLKISNGVVIGFGNYEKVD
jgi:hypothetical protein